MAERTSSLNRPATMHPPGHGLRLLEILTAIATVAALLAAGARLTGRLPSERAAPLSDRSTRLLQMGRTWDAPQVRWQGLFRVLDPTTGAETGVTLPLRLPENAQPLAFSADGRTLAYTDTQPPLMPPGVQQPASIVTVADIATGSVLRTLAFDDATFVMGLSTDGSRLVLYRFKMPSHPPFIVLTMDTATGATLNTVTLSTANGGWPSLTPDLRTAYWLDTHTIGAWPHATSSAVTLELVDMATGAQRTISLPMIHAGTFPQERKIGDEPVPRILDPGVAVSPDGARLYVVHPDTDAITVVNLQRGIVERTESIKPKQSTVARTFGWLAPERVSAKYMEGASKRARISPDGRTLAITGTTTSLRDDGQTYEIGDWGVQLVDLRSFTETAHLMQREYQGYALPLKVQWSADGHRLYLGNITSSTTPDGSKDAYQLQVMDARTRQITATQTYAADASTTRWLLENWFALPSST